MFCSRDYVDILKNLFMRFGCISTEKVIKNKQILIDGKVIIEQYLSQDKSLEHVVKRFQKYIGKQNELLVYFEGDYFLNNKGEYNVLNDFIYTKIIEKFELQADKILELLNGQEQKQKPKHIDGYTISQLAIQYQNQLMKVLTKRKINFKISCFQTDHQIAYDSMGCSSDTAFFCNPFLFALKGNINKIYFKVDKNKIHYYDFVDLSNKLKIDKQMIHDFFLLGYIFYRANSYFRKDIRINRIFKKNRIRLQECYDQELNRATVYLVWLFQRFKVLKRTNFSINFLQRKLQFSNTKKNYLQNILKSIQTGYVYDKNLGCVVSFNIITHKYQQTQINNFISDYGHYLKSLGLVPKEIQNWFFKKKNNCVFKTSLNYLQSKELFKIQRVNFVQFYREIIQNYFFVLFKTNPNKILIKKYYGNSFYYDIEPKKLDCKQIELQPCNEISILIVLKCFQESNTKWQKQKNCQPLNIQQIFNLAFLYFMDNINYLDFQNSIICHELEFLIKLSEIGYFEETIILLELYKKELIDKESFLLDVSIDRVVPNLKEKKQTLFQDIDFVKYQSDLFNMDLVTLFQMYQENKQEQNFQKFFYVAIKQNLLKSFHHFQENFQWVLLEIFLIIEQSYIIESKELVWSSLVSKVIQYHQEINNISIIALSMKNCEQYSEDYDLRSHRASQVVQCIADQFHALLMSILCNLAHQQEQIANLKKNIHNILFSFTSQCSVGAKVKKQIILLLIYPLIKTHFVFCQNNYLAKIKENFNFKKNQSCLIEQVYRFQQSIFQNVQLLEKSSFHKQIKEDSERNLNLLKQALNTLQEFKKDVELMEQII